MKFILLILATLLFTGCAFNEGITPALYDNYLSLSRSVKNSTIEKEKDRFFTESYLSKVDLNNKKSLLLLNLSGYMSNIKSHYQKIQSDFGCLTLNGFDEENEPLAIYVQYKNMNNVWLVNYMYINFLKSNNNFSDKAICPGEIESKKL